jgi:transcriptional regulator with XRE-family HTH domain
MDIFSYVIHTKYMTILVKFGITLRKHREERKMTQEELALKSHISVYYISKLERGKANPSIELLYKLAKALNLRPSQLID